MLNISVENEKLYNALLSLTKVVLDIVARRVQDDLPITTESVWVRYDEDSYVKKIIQCPEWRLLLHKAKDEITKTQEFSDFINILTADKFISPQIDTVVGTCQGGSRLEAIDIVYWLVSQFLTDKIPFEFEFNIDKFNAVYSKTEEELYADEIEFENITPLCGFTMEDSEIVLTENISIVKLSETEILEFLRLGIKLGRSMGDDNWMLDIHQYAIKISYKLPKIIGGMDNEDLEQFEKNEYIDNKNKQVIIDALRIYKEGKLYPISTVKKCSIFSVGIYGISFSFENPAKGFISNKYKLLKSEVDEFKSFWQMKNEIQLSEKDYLSVAIRRFSQSNERNSVEDRIIDIMIAAEAIFLSGIKAGELQYRLSHRASMFIETDVNRQRYVFNFMKKAYEVRSDIVHGSNLKLPRKMDGSFYTLEEFCGDIEKYLRISIKKIICLRADINNKSKEIDWESVIFPPKPG